MKKKVSKESKKMVASSKRINYEDIKDLSKEEQEEIVQENTKKAKNDAFREYVPYLIIIFFIVIIRIYIISPVKVNGTSMVPNFQDGDIVLNYKLKYRLYGAKRFEVVVVKEDTGDLIKRVIGLPGDKVRYVVKKEADGSTSAKLYINDEEVEEKFISDAAKIGTCNYINDICEETITIPDGEYYVMGDNRPSSKDSRIIGTIKAEDISGIVEVRLFPFSKFGNCNNNYK